MHVWRGSGLFLLMLLVYLVIPPVSPLPDSPAVTYSLMHISDLQSLTTHHPGTLNRTFSYIESLKEPYNLSGIIITGDVVNTWDDTKEWDSYRYARNRTTIPVYVIAGNHDTDSGNQYRYYTANTGMPAGNYVNSIGEFDLVGINFDEQTLPAEEFSRLRHLLNDSPRSHAIIATHYYMDGDGSLSPLGRDIDSWLITKPTLILMGHMHTNFLRARMIGGFPVVADMTNYQDGVPGGETGQDVSAGMLYSITSVDGRVERITARITRIFPDPHFEKEVTVFSRNPIDSGDTGSAPLAGTIPPADPLSACKSSELHCRLNAFFHSIGISISRIGI